MSGSSSNLDLLTPTDSSKEAELNALFDAASPSMLWGRRAFTTSGLTFGYYGGTYVPAVGTPQSIANGTVALAASNTNYLYADPVTGAVSVNTTGFPSYCIRLYQVTTNAVAATTYTDCRSYQPGAIGGTVAEFANEGGGAQIYDATNSTAQAVLLKELSAAPGSGMTVTDGGNHILFNINAGSVQGGANEGSGVGVLDTSSSTASTLKLKSLVQGAGTVITDLGNGNVSIGQQGVLNSANGNGSIVVVDPSALNFSSRFSVTGSGNTANVARATGAFGVLDTPPQLSSFTVINNNSAIISQQPWGISMAAASTGTGLVTALMKAAPATPYSVVARLKAAPFSSNYVAAGLCWSDGTKAQWAAWNYQSNESGVTLNIGNLNSLTSFSAFNSTPVNFPQFYDWLRIRDDGTNRYLDVSQDGVIWYNIFSISRTTWLTPTQVGFCFCSQGQALVASLFSWAGA